ncbi:MAG: hypothetical protein HC822_01270 [Oscillochloris sp.]|nr:hypothetical protein [Oscillochloris sp.]
MTRQDFNRPPRIRPDWPAEQIDLPTPPALLRRDGIPWVQVLLPLAGALIFAVSAGLGSGGWLIGLPMSAIAMLGVGAAIYQARRETMRDNAEYAARRALFEDQLAAQRGRLRRLHEHERAARLHLAPDPNELLHIAAVGTIARRPEPRLWERRISDDDFLALRAGCGNLPPSYTVRIPAPGSDAAADRQLQQLAAEHALLHQVPICIPLADLGSLGVAGTRSAALPLLQAMIWQMACLHGPADLRIAVAHQTGVAADWEWLRWLPHAIPLNNDSAHAARMIGDTPATVNRLLAQLVDELARRSERRVRDAGSIALPHEPWLVVLIDEPATVAAIPSFAELLRRGAELQIAVIVLALITTWCRKVAPPCSKLRRATHAGRAPAHHGPVIALPPTRLHRSNAIN